MAIGFIRAEFLTRGNGHNAVEAAAYRANESLYCERTGETFDYTLKNDLAHEEMLLPDGAGDKYLSREKLWNDIETIEDNHNRRKTARLAMELKIALPKELDMEESIKLVREFINEKYVVPLGVPADICIHDKGDGNPHAHVMIAFRSVRDNTLSRTKVREVSPGMLYGKDGFFCVKDKLHEEWKDFQNTYFAKNNIDLKVDVNHIVSMQHEGRIESGEEHHLKANNVDAKRACEIISLNDPDAVLDHLEKAYAVFGEVELKTLIFKHTVDSEDHNAYQKALDGILKCPNLIHLGIGEDGKNRYTTVANFNKEQVLSETAQVMAGRKDKNVSHKIITSVSIAKTLKEEQVQALTHVAHSGDVACILGRAGAGKTYTMSALYQMYSDAGIKVFGTAVAAKACKGLQDETGIESETIYSLIAKIDKGFHKYLPEEGSVLVVDEAGMVGLEDMAKLVSFAESRKIKLVLIGDPDQLQPVSKGAPFRSIAEYVGFARMEKITRQKDDLDKKATLNLASGKVAAALDHYASKSQLHLDGEQAVIQQLIQKWTTHSSDLSQTLIIAHTKDDVLKLNRLARNVLIEKGIVEKQGIALATKQYGVLDFAKGDRIIFTKNSRDLEVQNGQAATIMAINKDQLIVKDDDGKDYKIPLSGADSYNHLSHGYAATVHKTQGSTLNNTFAYLSGKGWNRFLTYVALSRHRDGCHIYANKDSFESLHDLKRQVSRTPLRDSVLDYPLAFMIRRGEDATTAANNAVTRIKGAWHKVRDSWTFLTNYEQHKIQKGALHQAHVRQQHNNEASLIASFADLNQSVNAAYQVFKEQYGKEWYKNPEAKEAYKPIADQFYVRNKEAYNIYLQSDKFERALELNRIKPEQLEEWSFSYLNETRVKSFESSQVNAEKAKMADEILKDKDHYRYISSDDLWADLNLYQRKQSEILRTAIARNINGFGGRIREIESYLEQSKQSSRYYKKSQAEHFERDPLAIRTQDEIDKQDDHIVPAHLERYTQISNQFKLRTEETAYKIIENFEDYLMPLSVRFPREETYGNVLAQLRNRANRYSMRLDVRQYTNAETQPLQKEVLATKINENRKHYWGIAKEEGITLDWKEIQKDSARDDIRLTRASLSGQDLKSFDSFQRYTEVQAIAREAYIAFKEADDALTLTRKENTAVNVFTEENISVQERNIAHLKTEMFVAMAERNEAAYFVNRDYPNVWDQYIPNFNGETFQRHISLHQERLDAENRVEAYVTGGAKDAKLAYEMTLRFGKHAYKIKQHKLDESKIWTQGLEYRYYLRMQQLDQKDIDLFESMASYDIAMRESAQLWGEIKAQEKINATPNKDIAFQASMTRNKLAFVAVQELKANKDFEVLMAKEFPKLKQDRLEEAAHAYQAVYDIQKYQTLNEFERIEYAGKIVNDYPKGAVYQALNYTDTNRLQFYSDAKSYQREAFKLSLSVTESARFAEVIQYIKLQQDTAYAWKHSKENNTSKTDAIEIGKQRNILAAKISESINDYTPYLERESVKIENLKKHTAQFNKNFEKKFTSSEVSHNQTYQIPQEKTFKRWDAALISERLMSHPEETYRQLFGEPKRQNSREMKWSGGLTVALQGSKRGMWYDFVSEQGGSPIQALQRVSGLSFVEALEQGAILAGLSENEATTIDTKIIQASPQKEAARIKAAEKLHEYKILAARSLWYNSKEIAGTLAERYMVEHRNIHNLENMELQFLPAGAIIHDYNEAGEFFEKINKIPAMIVAVRDKEGEITGVQRTYLDRHTANKASFMDNPKISKGVIKGNAGLVQDGASGRVYVAEGIETAASIAIADRNSTVLVSLSVSNLKNIADTIKSYLPKEVILLKDNDGMDAKSDKPFYKAVESLRESGLKVTVKTPKMLPEIEAQAKANKKKPKTDWNDVIQAKGVNAVRENIDIAIPEYDKNYKRTLDTWRKISIPEGKKHLPEYQTMMKHIKLKHESLVALANSYSRDNNKAGMEYADSVVDKARKSAFKVMSDPKLREAAEALGQFDKVKEDAFKHERVMKQGGKRISYEEAYKKALKFVHSKEFDRLAKEQGFKFGQSDTQESETPQTQKRGRTR